MKPTFQPLNKSILILRERRGSDVNLNVSMAGVLDAARNAKSRNRMGVCPAGDCDLESCGKVAIKLRVEMRWITTA